MEKLCEISEKDNTTENGNVTQGLVDSNRKNIADPETKDDAKGDDSGITSKYKYVYFLVLTALINGLMNGVLPSIKTYSCLPYGNEVYHLSATLHKIANPVASFAPFFIPVSSTLSISLLSAVWLVISGFILWTAATSPTPILVGTAAGDAIVVRRSSLPFRKKNHLPFSI